jgi:DNA polymerase-3 subunit delta
MMTKTDQLAESPLIFIYGEDEYSVKELSQELFDHWRARFGETDAEVIEAGASNSQEALKALDRMEGALRTLPFFGGAKLVWLKNCSFLGEDRVSGGADVTQRLAEVAEMLKSFQWTGVRLLISAGKVDTRRVFFKALSKIAALQEFKAISIKDRGWERQVEQWILREVKERGKKIDPRALNTLVLFVGPNLRQMDTELEKLCLYIGDGASITEEDVLALVPQNKQSKSFALADAIGERNLARTIHHLDNDLAEVKTNSSASELGILYGIISKVRLMLILRGLADQGYARSRGRDVQIDLPPGFLPEDKKFNPTLMNPFMVSKAYEHAMNYSLGELVRAMEKLFECNRALVFSGGDPTLALQQALVGIITKNQ